MAKIVSIENDIVKIGEDNGSVLEVKKTGLSFEPKAGDVVDVIRNGEAISVMLSTNTAPVSIVVANTVNTTPIVEPAPSAVPVESPDLATKVSENLPENVEVKTPEVSAAPVASSKSGKTVSKAIYCLLCFFLGFLGVHKFYSGKIGMGILYIFTLGLFGIGTIVDFLVGIFKKADENGNITI